MCRRQSLTVYRHSVYDRLTLANCETGKPHKFSSLESVIERIKTALRPFDLVRNVYESIQAETRFFALRISSNDQ